MEFEFVFKLCDTEKNGYLYIHFHCLSDDINHD